MKRIQTLVIVALLAQTTAFATSRELILSCDSVLNQDIGSIELYYTPEGSEVVVQDFDGHETVLRSSARLGTGLDSSIELPSRGSDKRFLQNRHTGWKVTVLNGGNISHESIDCD